MKENINDNLLSVGVENVLLKVISDLEGKNKTLAAANEALTARIRQYEAKDITRRLVKENDQFAKVTKRCSTVLVEASKQNTLVPTVFHTLLRDLSLRSDTVELSIPGLCSSIGRERKITAIALKALADSGIISLKKRGNCYVSATFNEECVSTTKKRIWG